MRFSRRKAITAYGVDSTLQVDESQALVKVMVWLALTVSIYSLSATGSHSRPGILCPEGICHCWVSKASLVLEAVIKVPRR